MISRTLTLPQLGLIAGTRAIGGAGIGLLLADRLTADQRRAVGWALLTVGVLTTVPLVADVLVAQNRAERREFQDSAAGPAAI